MRSWIADKCTRKEEWAVKLGDDEGVATVCWSRSEAIESAKRLRDENQDQAEDVYIIRTTTITIEEWITLDEIDRR